MNCNQARKYLYAFADGELDTPENLDVLEHLNMCPNCTQKVNVQQQLKANLARIMSADTAQIAETESLRASIVTMITAEAGAAHHAGASSGDQPSRHVRAGSRLYWISGAIAAMIGLAVLSTNRSGDLAEKPENLTDATNSAIPVLARYDYTDDSQAAITLANHVYDEHQHGCKLGPDHHNADLPRDLRQAAEQLTLTLNCPMLRCDNLPGLADASFESANVCKLVDVNDKRVDGGHIVLNCKKLGRISLISVHRLDEMENLKKEDFGGKWKYAVLKPDDTHTEGKKVTIVAFDCPKASHFVCAECDPKDVIEITKPMSLVFQDDRALLPLHDELAPHYTLASFRPRP